MGACNRLTVEHLSISRPIVSDSAGDLVFGDASTEFTQFELRLR